MKTDTIDALIQAHCGHSSAHSELRELLLAVIESRGRSADEASLTSGVDFICNYINQVPYMMKVAWTAGCNVGLEPQMQQILDAVRSYWDQDNDIIPDHLGVIGLLDDAYCSLTSLQAVSDHYQLQTGKFLFPTDLTSANRLMRLIIGEPYVSELDRFALNTLNDAAIMDAVKALASAEKQINFEEHSTIWNHGTVDSMDSAIAALLGAAE